MTVVLVHGNPETDVIWGPLVEALGRDDVVRLSPPGFGAPLPVDFPATFLAYRDWLEAELERFDEPVDLVGHDWGGGHVVNVVMHRPELVRSWASDVVGLFDPDYVWHDMAQVWQTPGAGEEVVEAMIGAPFDDRVAQLTGFGIPHDVATALASGQDEQMGRAILALYRSAIQPAMAHAGAHCRMPLLGRGCPCWRPRIRSSVRTTTDGAPQTRPAPAPRCSTVSGTGGCSTIPQAALKY